MNLYYYLHYRTYRFYERKGDSMPLLFSFLNTIVLLCANVFVIVGVSAFFFERIRSLISKEYALIFCILVGVFNYLTLYNNKKYLQIFNDFKKYEYEYKPWTLYVRIYMIITTVSALVVLVIADYNNHH